MQKKFYNLIKKDFTLSLLNELKIKDIFSKILSVITFKIYVYNIFFIGMLIDIFASNAPVRRAIEIVLMTYIVVNLPKQYDKKKSVKIMMDKNKQVSIDEIDLHFLRIFRPSFLNNSFEKFKSKNISASMRFEILNSENKSDIEKITTYKDVISVIQKENPEKIKFI